ncbi:ferritin-like domain-containing protein [Sulfurimonas sp. MAG313]|nr:ferritin-like domain-containing protein [Sulfurimonas sp. MAG313]MDF1879801.1 ferritin-like domain-containing protein [Sulfurimonas sp. MAG313]
MEFFTSLETLLTIQKPQEKCAAFKTFYKAYVAGECIMQHSHEAEIFAEPSYVGFCTLVSPTVVLKRRKLSTLRGKVIFLHAIAHIEYSAIDLAIDAAYRFKNLPKAYYDDFLSIAFDEVRHFEMLETLLHEFGSFYSDLPVHDSLFESCMRTLELIERMAVVPRYLEANGLDVTPMMIEKLNQLKDDVDAKKIIKVLEIILEEECGHVSKGDRWFKYSCDEVNKPYDIYFNIIEKHFPGSFPRKKDLNIKARQEAGFSCGELKKMNAQSKCS